MSPSTAEALARRATGALFLVVFGSGWLALGLAATHWLTLPTGLALGLAMLALVGTAGWVLRQTKPWRPQTRGPEEAAQARRQGRLFAFLGMGEGGAIFLVNKLLPQHGLAQYVLPAMALIVGLHFFPLARLFRYRGHYLTGGAMVLWTLGCLLLPPTMWQAGVAWGTGAILWLSAGYALGRAVRKLQPCTLNSSHA
ncbi:hypothetical protein [Hymenobacter crusticola]|uniref:Uncharacterized protein n=1 Tax=Hymenobacter crusticola TaxID=1770526 RepID=A0A243W9R5_9BACT|nr:hypothetical protein [Hymenobacter crusticola]OUJ71982.1 hypothetical protein BXP70_20440 [Hymenobacter crusticola]